MATTETSRLGLSKPDYAATADVDVINDNMDILDLAVGVSIVNTVAQITDPYNGQFAYELNSHNLRFFINGEWLLVAAGDQNSGNPDRIQLPPGSLDNMTDTTNAFQIGSDAGVNLAMDQNEIQARQNGAASTLFLNEQGGPVNIGPNSEIVISNKGIISTSMDSKEIFDGTNITPSATTWAPGTPAVTVDCEAPPSGKILVLLAARSNVNTPSRLLEISYEAFKPSGGGNVVDPGGSGNSIQNRSDSGNQTSQNNLTTTIPDLVKGLTPGDNYRFRVVHQKDQANTDCKIDFRKLIVIPQL